MRPGNSSNRPRLHQRMEELDGYSAERRAEQLLLGLGFLREKMDAPMASFSGGWRIRLNLARALMAPSDLMLLDEPTNHLDLDTTLVAAKLAAGLSRYAADDLPRPRLYRRHL